MNNKQRIDEKVIIIFKRIIPIILSIAIILPIVACSGVSDNPDKASQPGMGEQGQPLQPGDDTLTQTVTRGQWIDMLTSAMRNTLQFDSETEAFFTDVSPDNPYYKSIQIAAAYCWIDTEQETFNPNEDVTRAFVAVSTAKALGLLGEPVSELTDIHEQKDSEYIRLAVDSGILVSDNNIFNPNGAVLLGECREIINKVKILADFTVDPHHTNIMKTADEVITLQHATDLIAFNDSDAMNITVSEEIAAGLDIGTIYILPPSTEFPDGVARKVKNITRDGDNYIIVNELPAIEEVLSEIDVQAEAYVDFSNVIWDSMVTVESLNIGTQSQPTKQDSIGLESLSAQAQPLSSTGMSVTLDLGGGVRATLDIHSLFYMCKVRYSFGFPVESMVHIEESHTINITAAGPIKQEMDLFKIPIPILSGLSLEVVATLSVDGSFSLSIKNDMSSQINLSSGLFGFKPSARVSNIESTWETTPEFSVNCETGVTLKIGLNIFSLTLVEGSAFLGFEATATSFNFCTDIALYVICYLNFALLPEYEKVLDISHKIDIWTRLNSPRSQRWHYEWGELVEYCDPGSEKLLELWGLLGGGVWTDDTGYSFTFSIEATGTYAGQPKLIAGHSSWANSPFAIVTDMVILNSSTYRIYAFEEQNGRKFDLVFDIDISDFSDGVILIDGTPRYFQSGT